GLDSITDRGIYSPEGSLAASTRDPRFTISNNITGIDQGESLREKRSQPQQNSQRVTARIADHTSMANTIVKQIDQTLHRFIENIWAGMVMFVPLFETRGYLQAEISG